jgi:hypothetical protein
MIYKPEHVTDLESGAIVQAEVLEGDHAETKALSERVACAVEVVNRIVANEQDGVVRSLTADKGYFAIEEIAQIQEFDIPRSLETFTLLGVASKDWPLVAPSSSSRCTCCEKRVGQGAVTQARHAPAT